MHKLLLALLYAFSRIFFFHTFLLIQMESLSENKRKTREIYIAFGNLHYCGFWPGFSAKAIVKMCVSHTNQTAPHRKVRRTITKK